ncbi:hypothetical protein BJX70DRAFT_163618 [Aspergillus crustosus]
MVSRKRKGAESTHSAWTIRTGLSGITLNSTRAGKRKARESTEQQQEVDEGDDRRKRPKTASQPDIPADEPVDDSADDSTDEPVDQPVDEPRDPWKSRRATGKTRQLDEAHEDTEPAAPGDMSLVVAGSALETATADDPGNLTVTPDIDWGYERCKARKSRRFFPTCDRCSTRLLHAPGVKKHVFRANGRAPLLKLPISGVSYSLPFASQIKRSYTPGSYKRILACSQKRSPRKTNCSKTCQINQNGSTYATGL